MEPPSAGERIRPSATVILYRTAPELQVFLVERSMNTRFFPGYHAFPGGVVDEVDRQAASQRGGALDAGETDRAAAGVRELEEETGVRTPVASLRQAATLLTPPFGPTRYDTTFFVCEAPAGAEPVVDGSEIVSGAWIAPREALRRFSEEAWPVPPPTLAFLRALDASRDPVRVADESRALDGAPHHERFRIEMHPGVYVLPLRAPTLPPATTQNCWILDGDPILVIDPGTPREDQLPALVHTLDDLTRDGREVVVALTHHHPDHVAAVAPVKSRYQATVVAHAQTQDRMPRRLVDEAIEEGYAFDLGKWGKREWSVQALHTPGHAPGHLAFRDGRFGAIFAGDLVSGVSTILIDPDEGDMGEYLRSLQRCADLKPPIVLPGHGPALPGGAFAKTLQHRRMREAKVVAALSKGARALDEMLPEVYDDTPREAWALAARSLESILIHLEKEERAAREGDRWRAR